MVKKERINEQVSVGLHADPWTQREKGRVAYDAFQTWGPGDTLNLKRQFTTKLQMRK